MYMGQLWACLYLLKINNLGALTMGYIGSLSGQLLINEHLVLVLMWALMQSRSLSGLLKLSDGAVLAMVEQQQQYLLVYKDLGDFLIASKATLVIQFLAL